MFTGVPPRPGGRRRAVGAAGPADTTRGAVRGGRARRPGRGVTRLFPLPSALPRDPAVDAWLEQAPGPLGELARRWFAELRACGDDVRETMHDGQATACVGEDAFAYVALHSRHLSLGFFAGAELPDPAGLLLGAGRFMRHVRLEPGAPIDEEALRGLVRAGCEAVREARRRA